MLTDEIKKSIKQLKQLDILESAVQDAEKKAKNDSDYATLVTDFTTSMSKLSIANKTLNYELSDETLQFTEETIEKLESVISAGAVDKEELSATRQYVNRKVTPNLSKEWKTFHQKKTSGISGKLATIGSLVQDQDRVVQIKTNISNGSDWDGLSLADVGTHTRLDLLKSSIDEVDEIEESLNLSDEIRDFVVLVTRGKAKISDLNENIIKWIKDEKLDEKFIVDFKK